MFRKEALKYNQNRWSGRAVLITPISPILSCFFAAIFFISIFCFLFLGEYTRRVAVNGELVSVPRSITLFSEAQGVIVKQHIKPGEYIKKRQPILDIDISKTTRSGGISEHQIRSINDQIHTVDNIAIKLRENQKTTINMLIAQKKSYEDALDHSSEILEQARQGLDIMKRNMDNYRNYYRKGLINQDQLINQTSIYYQQHNDLLTLISQNEQNKLQVISLEGSIHTQSTDYDNQLYQLDIQRNELKRRLTDAEAESLIVITSPIEGKIDTLSTSLGQITRAGDALLQIIPSDTNHYELILWVPDNAVPFLKLNEKVKISYDAFPSEKYGLFDGEIIEIASTPASLQEMRTYPSSPIIESEHSKTWYRITVKPAKEEFWWQGKKINPENGMKAKCTLYLEKRKLYQWVLSPFYNFRDSIGGI